MEPPTESAFAPLGRRLVAQLQAAGRLWASAGISIERLNAEVLPRALVTGFLGDVAELQLAPDAVTIYNAIDWPSAAPPGGNLRDIGVSVSQHITSLVAAWNTQASDPPAFAKRAARAALWIARAEGFLPALDYFLDLFRDGLLIHPEVAVEVIRPLLIARRMTGDDRAAIDLFLDVSIADPAAWIGQPFKNFIESSTFMRDDLDDDLTFVLDRVSSEIEHVRGVASYDEWFVGQALLYHLTRFALHLFERLGCSDALPFLAPLARFEEVRADAGSFMTNARALSKIASWPYSALYSSAITYTTFETTPDEETVRRVVEERAVIPNALLERFWRNERDPETCSPPWQGFSSTMAPVVGRALFGDEQFWTRRRRPFTPEQIGVLAAGTDLFHGLDLGGTGAGTDGDGNGDVRGSFLTLCASTRSPSPRANLRAKGFSDARIDEILDTLLQRCRAVEIVTMLQIAEDRARTDKAAGAAVVQALIENYPWYANAYERAASYAESEHDGVAAAVEAIVLEPAAARRWHDLATAFRTSCKTQDAELSERVAARLIAAGNR